MARAKARGVEKVHQAVDGQPGMVVLLQPGVAHIKLSAKDRAKLRLLASLGWRLKRARNAEGDAKRKAEKIRDRMLVLMPYLPPGILGIKYKAGPRSSMHVELVPSLGREVTDVVAMLRLLRGRKVDVVKSFGFNAAELLGDAEKLERFIAALIEIYGAEALSSVLSLDLKWADFDRAIGAGKLPKKASALTGPSGSGSVRVDAKPL